LAPVELGVPAVVETEATLYLQPLPQPVVAVELAVVIITEELGVPVERQQEQVLPERAPRVKEMLVERDEHGRHQEPPAILAAVAAAHRQPVEQQ
jgi:hypothetical protein